MADYVLVEAEALALARERLDPEHEYWIVGEDDPARIAQTARRKKALRTLTPQSDGGEAIEVPREFVPAGPEDRVAFSALIAVAARLAVEKERDALEAEVERLRRVLRGEDDAAVLAIVGALIAEWIGTTHSNDAAWIADSRDAHREAAKRVLLAAGRAAGVVDK